MTRSMDRFRSWPTEVPGVGEGGGSGLNLQVGVGGAGGRIESLWGSSDILAEAQLWSRPRE